MSCTTRREESRSAKAFRALLALYPAAFRDEYGRELSLLSLTATAMPLAHGIARRSGSMYSLGWLLKPRRSTVA